jgi:hypothetical protein
VDCVDDPESPYDRLVLALAEWPGLVRRLLAQHPASGRCPVCTTPSGRRPGPIPCAPRALAERAAALPAAAERTNGTLMRQR